MQRKNKEKKENIKEHIFYVKGLHCASCEILVEKGLLEIDNIEAVEASLPKQQVLIEYVGEKPKLEELNRIFKQEGYQFSDRVFEEKKNSGFISALLGLGLVAIFLILNKLGLAGLVNVNSSSSLPAFFALGLMAGVSTCAALVGGLVLSMSKQWQELYPRETSVWQKLQPHFLFNIGRLVAYAVLGALLGTLGQKLQLSFQLTSLLVVAVSFLMIGIALRLLGFKEFQGFQPGLPKFITRYVANEENFKGRYLPAIMGGLTFFLPCGFTITAQGLALVSGSAFQGALIMLFFALGTLPSLFLIGFSSASFSHKPGLSSHFSMVAGILILFFAFFNINSQLNFLGWPSLSDIKVIGPNASPLPLPGNQPEQGLVPVVNGKQLLQMEASSSGYQPNYFKVKVGLPVRWEVKDTGTSGCTNAIISRYLFEGEIKLVPGQTSVKEFTPTTVGKYKFSCWMGMVSGIIEVVGLESSSVGAAVVSSGASGCGCGGGNGGLK